MKEKKKYVVLEHLTLPDRGFRFCTSASDDNTHSYKGDLWYKEVMFTDDPEEAIRECQNFDHTKVPSFSELMTYYKEKRENEDIDEL